MRLAIFASGNGSNFQALAEAFPDVTVLLFSDHHDAAVLDRAAKLGITTYSRELREFPDKKAYEAEIVRILQQHEIDLICLAGYMKIVSRTLLNAYADRILNIHPSFLPAFTGSPHAIEESWRARTGLGVTVHWVDAGVDTGAIIAQRPVKFDESLEAYEARLHATEHQLYPEAVRQILSEQL